MQPSRIFQRRIVFLFLVVVNQAERVVEVGDLGDIQLVDIATGAGSDVAATVKLTDGQIRSRVSHTGSGHA